MVIVVNDKITMFKAIVYVIYLIYLCRKVSMDFLKAFDYASLTERLAVSNVSRTFPPRTFFPGLFPRRKM